MAKEQIGSNATFSGPQKGLTVIGNHCYAMSGSIAINNTATETLNFTTGTEYILGSFQAQYFSDGNDVYQHLLTFNGELVIGFEFNGSNNADGALPRTILIPPLTHVVATADNTTDSSANNVGAVITGRVYE